MPYSSEELTKAIDSIVRSSIRFEYGPIGQRKLSVSFGDIQDAAAGVLCRFDSAPFYVAKLAASRLNELAQSMADFINEMVKSAMATSRYVGPVERLSGLANARVALNDLAGAGAARGGAFQSIEAVPAYARFEKGTANWLAKEGVKVRSGGDIVQTPSEAQSLLRQQAIELRSRHDEILRRVQHLESCIDDYDQLNLPATLAASIIENSAKILEDQYTKLEAMNPDERTAHIRDVTLDVLAARACVRGFGSLNPTGLFVKLSGDGEPFADASHPAEGAELTSTLLEPYNFFEGHQNVALVCDAAGSTKVDVTLQMPSSFVPFVGAAARNPVTLGSSIAFGIDIDDSSYPPSSLTIGAGTYELYELANIINAQLTNSDAESYIRLLGGITTIGDALAGTDIIFRVPGSDDVPLPTPAPLTWVQQGVLVGHYVLVIDRSSGMFRSLWQVTAFQNGNYEMVCSNLTGSAVLGDELSLEIGDASLQLLYIGVKLAQADDALDSVWQLILTEPSPNQLSAIGLQPTIITARQTTAKNVVDAMKISASARDDYGAARVEVSSFFDGDTYKARTNPANAAQLYIYKARGEATALSAAVSSAVFSFNPTDDWSTIGVGDFVVIRETEVPLDVNNLFTITSIDWSTYTVNVSVYGLPPTVDGVPVVIEVIRVDVDLTNFSSVVIEEGTAIDGTYEVGRYKTGIPGLLPLNTPFPLNQHISVGGNPIFFEAVRWGRNGIIFKSLNTTLSSYLHCRKDKLDVENPPNLIPAPDDASSEFFGTAQPKSYATTPWYALPGRKPAVEIGDTLELYNTNALSPDSTHTVVAGESDYELLQVSPVVEMPQTAVPFDVGSPVPFGRVRKLKKQNFGQLQRLLNDWLKRPEANTLQYFRKLDSLVNPVVSNLRPTTGMVSALVRHLQDLQTALEVSGPESLGYALTTYDAKIVDQVDVLLKSYRAKGADRAADIFEEARFSDFFGLTMDGASYGGRLQETLKAAARELPIRKTNRQNTLNSGEEQIIAQFDDVDLEYVADDAVVGDNLSIPEANDYFSQGLIQP